MNSFLLKTFLALALVSVCSADLADNQIEDDVRDEHVMTRGRYTIRGCKPCGRDQCQVMGMQRFSEPRCEAYGGVGAPCRPFQEPENKTLNFPNMVLYCDDVYMQFCPCAPGLVCDLQAAECTYLTRERPTLPPQRQPRQQETGYPFTYVQPERYTSDDDDGFDDDVETEDDSAPVAYEPLTYQRRESLTIRSRPQWLP